MSAITNRLGAPRFTAAVRVIMNSSGAWIVAG